MFLIRNNKKLRIFSDDNGWTDNIADFKEYEDRQDALADILKYKLSNSSVVPIKEWVKDLFAAGRVRLA